MFKIDIRGVAGVQNALKNYPAKAHRACAVTLNQTAKSIKAAERNEMLRVFDRPTRYTLNSLYTDTASKNKLSARVWLKDPDRSSSEKISGVHGKEHYLVPQVHGGTRQLKAFERVFGGKQMVPGSKVRLDRYGNVGSGKILQIMSVLGKLSRYNGDAANITNKYRKINTKERDYVYIPSMRGKLRPGIYERYQTGRGFGAKTKKTFKDRSKVYQRGQTRKGISSVIRGRGLRSVLIQPVKQPSYSPRLDFYGVANMVFKREFESRFWKTLCQYYTLG